MNDLEFGREFLIWQRRVGVDRRAQAAFMFAMKSLKDPLSFIQGVNQNNVNLPGTFAKLTSDGADMSEITKMITDLKVREEAKKARADKEKDSGKMTGVQFTPAQEVVKPEGETEEPGDSKVVIPVPGGSRKFEVRRRPRPMVGRDEKPEGSDNVQAKPETEVEIVEPELTGPKKWLAAAKAKVKSFLPGEEKELEPIATNVPVRSNGFGGGARPQGDSGSNSNMQSPPHKIKPQKNIWSILFFVVAVFLVIIALIGISSSFGGSGLAPELDLNAPAVQQAGSNQDPQAQLENLNTGDIFESTESMLKKPSWKTFDLDNFPWIWIGWILFVSIPLFSLRQDRFAAHEETDLRTVAIGLIVLSMTVIFSGPLSKLVSFEGADPSLVLQVQNLIAYILFGSGVVFNIGMQLSATLSGKKDFSALAVAGLFVSGVVIIWWYPDLTVAQAIGWLLLSSGIVLEYHEISESNQAGGAITVSLLMIFGFLLGFWIGLRQITEWIVWLHSNSPSVFWVFIYDGRFFLSAIFGMVLAVGMGLALAMVVLRTERDSGGSVEDSASSIAKLGKVVLYDAIAFGAMLMYPLSYAAWYMTALAAALNAAL